MYSGVNLSTSAQQPKGESPSTLSLHAQMIQRLLNKLDERNDTENYRGAAQEIIAAIKSEQRENLLSAIKSFGNKSTTGDYNDREVKVFEEACTGGAKEVYRALSSLATIPWSDLKKVADSISKNLSGKDNTDDYVKLLKLPGQNASIPTFRTVHDFTKLTLQEKLDRLIDIIGRKADVVILLTYSSSYQPTGLISHIGLIRTSAPEVFMQASRVGIPLNDIRAVKEQ